MCAEGYEIKRAACEDAAKAQWPPSEITLHGESVQHFKQNCSRCSQGPAGRLSTAQPSDVDRPQVLTPDGFVPRQTDGYSALPVGCSAWNWQWLWIAIVPAGFAVYLLINWSGSGDPFTFLQARKTLFEQSFAFPLTGIRQAIWAHYPTPHEAEMVGTQELFFVALCLYDH